MIGIPLAFITSLVMMLMCALTFRAYWPMLRSISRNTFEGRMFLSMLWICGTLFARSLYWDFTQQILGRDGWVRLRDALGGQEVSTAFNIGFAIGLYHALYAVTFLIKREDRPDWPWWRVWMYPKGPCVTRIRGRKWGDGE